MINAFYPICIVHRDYFLGLTTDSGWVIDLLLMNTTFIINEYYMNKELMSYAGDKGPDQTAHARSLIRAFVVRTQITRHCIIYRRRETLNRLRLTARMRRRISAFNFRQCHRSPFPTLHFNNICKFDIQLSIRITLQKLEIYTVLFKIIFRKSNDIRSFSIAAQFQLISFCT